MSEIINPNVTVVSIHSTLWEVKNVFTDSYLAHLDQFFEHGNAWHMDRRLARMSHPVGNDEDPFWPAGEAMSALVTQAVGQPVQYRKAKLFLDLPGSEVPKHTDASDIDVMTQIYLKKSDHPVPGTMFLEPYIHTVKYEYNCGYFNLNTDRKIHQSPFVINGYRTSMGFQFYFPK